MSLAIKAYTAFKDDEAKAKALSEIFEEIENNYIHQKDALTPEHLQNVNYSLRLEIEKVRKEVEQVRKEIIEAEGRLAVEIKEVESGLTVEIKEVEGRLTLEIEKVRSEVKEAEGRLTLEIEKVRSEVKEVEGSLSIKIEKVRTEVEKVKTDLIKHMNRHIIWVIGSISLVIGALKALDYFLK